MLIFLRKFLKDKTGSFSIFFSVSALLIMIGVGAAYDMQVLLNHKTRLQDMADAAALSGAKFAIEAPKKREQYALASYQNNKLLSDKIDIQHTGKVVFHDEIKEVVFTINGTYKTTLIRILGKKEVKLQVQATAVYTEVKKETKKELAIAFVLGIRGPDRQIHLKNPKTTKYDFLTTSYCGVPVNINRCMKDGRYVAIDIITDLFAFLSNNNENGDFLADSIRVGLSIFSDHVQLYSPMRDGYKGTLDTLVKYPHLYVAGNSILLSMRQAAGWLESETTAKRRVLVMMAHQDISHAPDIYPSPKNKPILPYKSYDGRTLYRNRPTELRKRFIGICQRLRDQDITLILISFKMNRVRLDPHYHRAATFYHCLGGDLSTVFDAGDGDALIDYFREIGKNIQNPKSNGIATIRLKN